jgi:hypothetical protein
MRFPDEHLARLRHAGLVPVVPEGDHDERNCVMVVKPIGLGNSLFSLPLDCDDGLLTDLPPILLNFADGSWVARTLRLSAPGPAPEDFVHQHGDPDSVVADLLEFFLGESKLIEAGKRARSRIRP